MSSDESSATIKVRVNSQLNSYNLGLKTYHVILGLMKFIRHIFDSFMCLFFNHCLLMFSEFCPSNRKDFCKIEDSSDLLLGHIQVYTILEFIKELIIIYIWSKLCPAIALPYFEWLEFCFTQTLKKHPY